jgi:hypothetical protein
MNDKNSGLIKPVLNAHEVSELLGVTVAAVARWTSTGVLPSHKIGSINRYNRREIMDLVGGDNPTNDSGDPITTWLIEQLNKRRNELGEGEMTRTVIASDD